jgi:hypothetical protein
VEGMDQLLEWAGLRTLRMEAFEILARYSSYAIEALLFYFLLLYYNHSSSRAWSKSKGIHVASKFPKSSAIQSNERRDVPPAKSLDSDRGRK